MSGVWSQRCRLPVSLAVSLLLIGCLGTDPPTPTPVALPTAGGATPTAGQARPTSTRPPPPSATPTPVAFQIYSVAGSGGFICRAGRPVGSECEPVLPNINPLPSGGEDDIMRANTDGGLGAQLQAARLRLLPGSEVQLRRRSTLSGPQRLLLRAGQVLFDHQDADGAIEIGVGQLRVQPIDTEFSVRVDTRGAVKVSVLAGEEGVVITNSDGFTATVRQNEQVYSLARRPFSTPQPLDAETRRVWLTYGQGESVAVACPPDITNQLNAPVPTDVDTRLGCPVQKAQFYSDAGISPNPIAEYERGELVYDIEANTVYAIYTDDSTWDSFSFNELLGSFIASHADVAERLGALQQECDSADWSLQRFAGGTLLSERKGCSLKVAPALVLYPDGTWQGLAR